MFEPQQLNELARRISEVIPQDLTAIKSDFETNIKAILQASLSRMNLVTREEFDVQRKVLLRAREQIDAMEERIKALENSLKKD